MQVYLQVSLLLASGAAAQNAAFDYVIAGAGTAGLVIANRLSEDPNINVAVIEPGDDVRDYPGVMTVNDLGNIFNASTDWQYNTTVQPGAGNRSIEYHAGKAIGGTSNINGTITLLCMLLLTRPSNCETRNGLSPRR
jgi:choline dehydrogenase